MLSEEKSKETTMKLDKLLDYEDYFPEDVSAVNPKTMRRPKRIKKKRRKAKLKRDSDEHIPSKSSFCLDLIICEKLGLIRDEVYKQERKFARDRDVSVRRLREDVHENVLSIREQKKCNLLASRRNIDGHIEIPCEDNQLVSIIELVWGFNNLTCSSDMRKDKPNMVSNYMKRKISGIDSTSYYETPELKKVKLSL